MNKCIVCKGESFNNTFSKLLECKKCGHIFANINLNEKEINNIYNNKYFFGNQYYDYLRDRKLIEKNAKLRLKKLLSFLPNTKNLNLLEIGCAYGFYLNYVKNIFKNVEGFDFNPEGIDYAKKVFSLNVSESSFLKKKFQGNMYDLFCMWDVIEHLQDPHLYLKKISQISNKNALIAITTGDIKSINAKWRKDKWRLIHPPMHIHYFSKKSINEILKNNGFKVIYCEYCGYFRSFLFMAYRIKFIKKYFSWFLKLLKILKIPNFGIYLNLFDIMFIIAIKKK